MQTNTDNWTQKEFFALLTLYVSRVNDHTPDDDIRWIREHFGAEAYESAQILYNRQSEYDNIQSLLQLRERLCPGHEGRQEIHRCLEDFFMLDGRFTQMEQHVLQELERLFR